MVAVETVSYRPRGPIRDLFLGPGKHVAARYSEVLIEGEAGSGKTFGVANWMHQLGKESPRGTRILWVRQTRSSMTESVLVSFEEVLESDDEYRSFLLRGAARDNRTSYDYPHGVHIALGSMDHPERLYSTQWDIVWVEEGVELGMIPYLKFKRALRNGKLPFQTLITTTNPKSQYHWLNRRFPEGMRSSGTGSGEKIRLLSKAWDNPKYLTGEWLAADPELLADLKRDPLGVEPMRLPPYLRGLRSNPEPLLSQLFLGRWVSATGLVWPQYDEGRHLTDLALLKTEDGRGWVLTERGPDAAYLLRTARRVKWFGASMDFGYSNPGCLGVWAVLEDNTSVLVREVYRAGWQQEQWAEAIEEIHKDTPISRLIGDCAEPRFLDYLNDRLSFARGHKVGSVVRGCDKSKGKIHGLNAVRRALDEDALRFLRPEERMRHWPDPTLPEDAPTCSTEEVPSYVYPDPERAGTPEARLKREQTEQPDPTCVDHGCDMIEYWSTAMYGDRTLDLSKTIKPEPPKFGTASWVMDLPDSGSPRRGRR